MPGHVTTILRATAASPASRSVDDALSLSAAPPASPERRAELMAQIRRIADRKTIQ